MLKLIALAAAGALGTLSRYWLTGLVHRYSRESFPWGTLVVNILGCFLIGIVMCFVQERQLLGPESRVVIVVGLLGGFTTFSAFGYETVALVRGGEFVLALLNILGNVFVGMLAVWLGTAAVRVMR